jgi:hypothetical protein
LLADFLGDGRQRGPGCVLRPEWLVDEMVADQECGEARLLGLAGRAQDLRGSGEALREQPESEGMHALCNPSASQLVAAHTAASRTKGRLLADSEDGDK